MTLWQERAATVVMTGALMLGISGASLVLAWGCYVVARWVALLP